MKKTMRGLLGPLREAKQTESSLLLKKKCSRGILLAAKYFFLLSLSYIVLFQLFYMLSYSFRTLSDTYNPNVVWVPSELTLQHFKDAFQVMNYPGSLLNSLVVGQVSGLIEVLVCSLIAYGFARFDFRGKNLLFFLVLLTIMVPVQMLIVPMYLNYSHFDVLGILDGFRMLTGIDLRPNLIDTPLTFYLPSLFGVGVRSGLFIFIYRKFFEGLPKELEEAAYVDGAGPIRTFFSVILPSASVVFVTVFIFSTIWHWNESYMSSMFFSDAKPLSVVLEQLPATIKAAGSGIADSRNIRMAACLLFILPMLLMYVIAQKKFVQSIDRVGIVG